MMKNNISISLNQSQIKMLAVFCMLIDHIGYAFYGQLPHNVYFAMRCIGRTAFPIFACMLVEGFFHTKKMEKHLLLLAVFCLLSEIPFNLFMDNRVFSTSHQSVMVTLFLSFLGMILFKYARGKLWFLALIGLMIPFLADFLHTDYGGIGVITVYLFYLVYLRHPEGMSRISPVEILAAMLPLFSHAFLSWSTEYACVLAVPVLLLYNGERGKGYKYFFYAFYPLHILAIVLLHSILFPG